MFCPSCGLKNAENHNYCKRCGAEMFEPELSGHAPKLRLGAMFWAIGAFGFCGLALLFMGYLELASQGLRGDALFLPFALGFVLIGTIAALLVWQLSRLITIQQQQLLAPRPIRRKRQELPVQPTPQQLPSVSSTDPIPLSSVVEGTTRQFAPVYREAQERESH
jgi:hypothetical protein